MSDAEYSDKYPQTPIKCGECEDSIDVSSYCKTCAAPLCNTCKDKNLHRKHFVVPNTLRLSSGPRITPKKCDVHPDEPAKTFCQDHKAFCCKDCLKVHNGHDIIDIENAYKKHEKRVNDFIDKLEQETIPKIEADIIQLKQKQESETPCYNNVREDMNKFREKIKNKIDQIFGNFEMEMDRVKDDYHSQYSQVIQQGEKHIEMLKSLKADSKMKIREGDLSVIYYYPTIPTCNLLCPPVPKHVDFQTRQGNIDSLGEYLGSLKVSDAPPRGSHITFQSVREYKAKICASSIAPTGDGNAWISLWKSDKIYLYDRRQTSSVNVKEGSEIWDITLTNDGDILVANKDNCVRILDKTSKEVSNLVDTKPFSPQGLCLTDKNEIVVCMAIEKQVQRNHVAIYSPDGKSQIRRIEARNSQEKSFLTDPIRVVMTGKCIHVVNHRGNVVTMDIEGNVKWEYDGSEAKRDRAFDPMGICGDKKGNLLISDCKNNCVHLVDQKNGTLIQIVLSQEQHSIEKPYGIQIDEAQKVIWLGNANESTAKLWIANYIN